MARFCPRIVAAATLLLAVCAYAPAQVLINEDFNDVSQWNDLSTALTWGGHTGATSAFAVTSGALGLTADAIANISYTSPTGLRTFTAIDRQFAQAVSHSTQTLTIDIRMRWDGTASAEAGRFNISLNTAYPANGLDMTLDKRYNDFTQAWWARPAYHIRMRSGNTGFLGYGGGADPAGEYEAYDVQGATGIAPTNPAADWWLPGFIRDPGQDSSFPAGTTGWVTTSNLASTQWTDYRYIIAPDRQEIWSDTAGNGIYVLRGTQLLPQTSSTLPFYQYFDSIEGIRLYWRGADAVNQAHVDSITVTVTPEPASLMLLAFAAPMLFSRRTSVRARRH